MHELSITQNILSIALDKANEAHASRVSKVNLVIGELAGIASDSIQLYFDLLSKDTIAAEAVLSFRQPPTQLVCHNCATSFTVHNGMTCPNCQQQNTEVVSGRELYVEGIEVE